DVKSDYEAAKNKIDTKAEAAKADIKKDYEAVKDKVEGKTEVAGADVKVGETKAKIETTKEKKATAVKKPVKKGKHATNATRAVVVEEIVQPVIIEVQEVKK
ncbi:hypothetical protein, partial [Fusobacterium periodonticum]